MMTRRKLQDAFDAAALRALLAVALLVGGIGASTGAMQPGPATDMPRDVKNVNAVPFLNTEGKDTYQKWVLRPYNRAFAINPRNGDWGAFPDDDDLFKMQQDGPGADALRNTPLHFALEDALNRCQKQPGDKCFIYAQNGTVVWNGRVAEPTAAVPGQPVAAPAAQQPVAPARIPQAGGDRPQQALQAPATQRTSPPGTPGPNRRALVFGNDNYKFAPGLSNARADARAIAMALTSVGYSVRAHFDLGERDMKKAIRDFTSSIAGGDEVVFFFAGHGVQIGSANYLLPVDIRAEDAASVRDESIALQRVLDDMADAKARLALMIIDACRDNPFRNSGRAIGGRGLAATSAATGQMIMFSAGVGQQAMDKLGPADDSPNGLFTRVLLKHLPRKGVTVDKLMRDIRSEVVTLAKAAGHDQVPAIYDQVVGDFYFAQ